MNIVNDRLIVAEDDLKIDCRRIENSVRGYLYTLGHPDSDVEVYFDDECYNEDFGKIWNEIEIQITHPNQTMSYLSFATEGYMPTLVSENGKMKFYFVFELMRYTSTDEHTLLNGSYPDMIQLELMIWENLKRGCEKNVETFTVTLTK